MKPTSNKPQRLDKLLANNTQYSRSEIKKILRTKEITVDGEIVTQASVLVSPEQRVAFYGQVIEARAPRYFMLNKPQDVVSASVDEEHMTALDLIEEPFYDELHLVGRLDKDTTGLLLITDDGAWTQRLTSPKRALGKTYQVITARPMTTHYIQAMQDGLLLRSETTPTAPAELMIIDEHHAELTITEGRYHQVRRMFAALGNHVQALHRISIGSLTLDDDLPLGEYRPLTDAERHALNTQIGLDT